MSSSVQIANPRRRAQIITQPRGIIRPKAINDNFREDIIRCFNGEGGGIGFYGYAGEGGKLYARWLAENDAYRSQVTLAEIELTTDSAQELAKLSPNAKSFLQVGASGSYGVYFTKPYPLIQAIIAGRENRTMDYKVADVSEESFRKNEAFIEELKLNFSPKFVRGNFYASLYDVKDMDVIYVPGLTIQNPYFDAIKNSAEDILRYQLTYFRRSLAKGGTLAFSFANDNGIDKQGSALKRFYDDPLIHAYQKTIFKRIAQELSPTGNYDPNNFDIRHDWREGQHVLTRHAVTKEPMTFGIGRNRFDWEAGHELYISNNTRYPDEMVRRIAKEVGFKEAVILGPPKSNPHSNMRIAALING